MPQTQFPHLLQKLGLVGFSLGCLSLGAIALIPQLSRHKGPSQEILSSEADDLTPVGNAKIAAMIQSGLGQIGQTRGYNPEYVAIAYPMGDVPLEKGVCTDVVIRALRQAGVDLQQAVHEDMRANFGQYPTDWGLAGPDPNIDHRRVPNLMTFFQRRGKALPPSQNPQDYQPGDLVAWDLGGGNSHIGLVTNLKGRSPQGSLYKVSPSQAFPYKIVHNIGAGTRLENVLFNWKIIGHYRYF
jgi:uncharacterized protein